MKKIAVVGTGYVGLVTGTCLAEMGNEVMCVDVDTEKVKKLQGGTVPIYEPHLEGLFQRNVDQGRLQFTTDLKMGVKAAEIIFLALPTPSGENGEADLQYVMQVAKDLGPLITDFKLVVSKSTVPVGTTDKVREVIAEQASSDFEVVSNPEFLREGLAVDDFMHPERIVIGCDSERAQKLMGELYAPFVQEDSQIMFMDVKSAEVTKYAANSFLAMKITFMNEIANFCEQVGADVDFVRTGVGADSRIGNRFLQAGIGYGGSCFPKDVKALVHMGQQAGAPLQILQQVMEVNEKQSGRLVAKLVNHFGGKLLGKRLAVWGLAFKPNTDDVREAPAIKVIQALLKRGAEVVVYDPEAMEEARKQLDGQVSYAEDEYQALTGVDGLVIATEWGAFQNPDFGRMKKLMKQPVIFDGRNVYDIDTMMREGFDYYSVGRKTAKHEE